MSITLDAIKSVEMFLDASFKTAFIIHYRNGTVSNIIEAEMLRIERPVKVITRVVLEKIEKVAKPMTQLKTIYTFDGLAVPNIIIMKGPDRKTNYTTLKIV